jgi:hypothetical protein
MEHPAATRLSPSELALRLDRLLAATETLIAEVPDAQMEYKAPEGNRTLRHLAYHVFRLSLAFADGMDIGRLPGEWLQEQPPGDLRDGRAIARYGALVRGRLTGWFEGAAPQEYARTIEVDHGLQSGHELLERTTWQAAQHLRQLHAVLEGLSLLPREPLPTADFERLPAAREPLGTQKDRTTRKP